MIQQPSKEQLKAPPAQLLLAQVIHLASNRKAFEAQGSFSGHSEHTWDRHHFLEVEKKHSKRWGRSNPQLLYSSYFSELKSI